MTFLVRPLGELLDVGHDAGKDLGLAVACPLQDEAAGGGLISCKTSNLLFGSCLTFVSAPSKGCGVVGAGDAENLSELHARRGVKGTVGGRRSCKGDFVSPVREDRFLERPNGTCSAGGDRLRLGDDDFFDDRRDLFDGDSFGERRSNCGDERKEQMSFHDTRG